ncbi:MAG: thiol:disulfide interchange protein DsbA/DsbL [Arenimonas sp.]
MLRRVLIALSFLLPLAALAQPMAPGMPRAGIDYVALQAPQPTFSNVKGKIEVVEVFSYACPHCAHFQPFIGAWKKKAPADVNFIYMHAAGGGAWERFARGFYVAESKKILPRTHDALFKSIFEERKLTPNASLDEIADFYAGFGVDKDSFLAAMMSKTINEKVTKSTQFSIRTGADSTPTIVINGKYKINATQDRGLEGMIKTIDFIIAKERAAMKLAKTKVAAK